MASYKVTVNGELRMTFDGDFSQASSPLLLDGRSTPFRVADARHYPRDAAKLLNEWMFSEGWGRAWEEGEEFEVE